MGIFKRVCGSVLAGCLLAALLLAAGCGLRSENTVTVQTGNSAHSAEIKMLDIGQGDAFLIKVAGQVVMVDTGDVDTRDQLVQLLKKEGITTIDKLIISHPHADHLGGAVAVLNHFTVKNVYDNGQVATSNTYRTYLKTIKKQNIPYKRLRAGDILEFGNGAAFTVYSPVESEIKLSDDLNNNSIVGKFTFGDFSMMFTGDSEAEAEKAMLKKYGEKLSSTVIKSPHHGSKTSSNRNYLKMVSPEAALISVGAGNDYQHPHMVTLNKYKDMNIKIYRTDMDGAITIRTDGKTYKIEKEK